MNQPICFVEMKNWPKKHSNPWPLIRRNSTLPTELWGWYILKDKLESYQSHNSSLLELWMIALQSSTCWPKLNILFFSDAVVSTRPAELCLEIELPMAVSLFLFSYSQEITTWAWLTGQVSLTEILQWMKKLAFNSSCYHMRDGLAQITELSLSSGGIPFEWANISPCDRSSPANWLRKRKGMKNNTA